MFSGSQLVFNKLTGSIGKIIEVRYLPNDTIIYRIKHMELGLNLYPFNLDAYYPENLLLPCPIKFIAGEINGDFWEVFLLNHPVYSSFFCFAIALNNALVQTKNFGVNCHLQGSFTSIEHCEDIAMFHLFRLLDLERIEG